MAELFADGESIEVEFGWFACHAPRRDDLVLAQVAGRADPIMKIIRVVPGDRFALVPVSAGFRLDVNGRPLTTPHGVPYVFTEGDARMLRLYEKQYAGVLPEGMFLVFGTQPHGSLDSSRFGPVPREQLLGRIVQGIPRPARLSPRRR